MREKRMIVLKPAGEVQQRHGMNMKGGKNL